MKESESARLFGYLTHILQAIDRIHNYTEELDEVAFLQNQMAQDAVIRNLEVIGEASRNIRQRFPAFADVHPELPLASAYEMRNVLAHGYFKVDLAIVWQTLETDLPELQAQTRAVIRAERLDSGSGTSD